MFCIVVIFVSNDLRLRCSLQHCWLGCACHLSPEVLFQAYIRKKISGNRLVQIHLQTEELVDLPAHLNSPVICNVNPSFLNMFLKISNVNLIVECVTNDIVTFACDWPFISEAHCTGPIWTPLRTYKHFQTSEGGVVK